MKPRRPNRWRYKNRFCRMAQHVRLDRIAAGLLEPDCDRERGFLHALRMRGRADPEDFIIPGLLFYVERAALRAPSQIPDDRSRDARHNRA